MSSIYDNWERLVDAVLKKQELWELFHARSPSLLSEASSSDIGSISNLSNRIHGFDFLSVGSSSRLVPEPVIFSSDFSSFDAFFASAELLGRGTFGNAYLGLMESGEKIVVRRLKSSSVSERDFKFYMEILRDVRHENVIPLRECYSWKDERIMVHDYCSESSVYELLHGLTGENRAQVDWETRMRIAIGAAKGIAAIHSHLGGTLVHGNIHSSNIFLNSENYGCVSDLGLARAMHTTFMPNNALCYAPEVKNNTRNVSQASDVYSFGVLLLELFTRRSPRSVPGGPKAVDLVKFVRSEQNKNGGGKVFDADLDFKYPSMSHERANVLSQIATRSLAEVRVLEIGTICTEKSTKQRPKMSQVVEMLEDACETVDVMAEPPPAPDYEFTRAALDLLNNPLLDWNADPTSLLDQISSLNIKFGPSK